MLIGDLHEGPNQISRNGGLPLTIIPGAKKKRNQAKTSMCTFLHSTLLLSNVYIVSDNALTHGVVEVTTMPGQRRSTGPRRRRNKPRRKPSRQSCASSKIPSLPKGSFTEGDRWDCQSASSSDEMPMAPRRSCRSASSSTKIAHKKIQQDIIESIAKASSSLNNQLSASASQSHFGTPHEILQTLQTDDLLSDDQLEATLGSAMFTKFSASPTNSKRTLLPVGGCRGEVFR